MMRIQIFSCRDSTPFQWARTWGQRRRLKLPIFVYVAAMLMLVSAMANGAEVYSETLAFESDSLDLDSGAVIDLTLPSELGADIYVTFNALSSPGAVMTLAETGGGELSYLEGVTFESVTTEMASGLNFSSDAVGLPVRVGDTVVVRTDTGAVFKIGNAVESETGITFDYSQL